MTRPHTSVHGEWSSRWVFVLAATGSAVGLGNIWKFPYITGENGGGAFVLVYLVCVAVVGIPIMIAEVMIGRRGRQSPIHTMRSLALEAGKSSRWQWLGWSGVLAGFLILSYYSVIAGWGLAYVVRAGAGVFNGAGAEQVGAIFNEFLASPERLLAWHTIFMVMTMVVVARGVRGGLEKAVRFLMPALFVLLLLLVGYAMSTGSFTRGLEFLFRPDFSKLSQDGVLIAMGHAFFTLSLGMGAIMIYGSYLPGRASIAKTSFLIAGADTVVALMAGMAIFPIVFANGMAPASGPGLLFVSLPVAFGQMPGGVVFGMLFFVLVVFAAWTSSISLIEPAVAWLVEYRGMRRLTACLWAGVATWLLGIGTVLSFNLWAGYKLFGKTFFDLLDYLTANIMLPAGGLFIALFAAWVMKQADVRDELAIVNETGYRLWWFLVRFVTPVAVVVVFLSAIGVIGKA
ncbi:MAG TPA: sodium-dependent transporter [Gammaproteobacteria bacterium]|nr:sodium-dependent transporter [Gammaproteobacteria bacterium]